MNYRGFTFPIWGFLANTDISYDPQKIDAQTCMAWMDNYRAGLSHQQQLRMFNQLDSHDTARFKSLLWQRRSAPAAGGGVAVQLAGGTVHLLWRRGGVDGQ
ncbi:maltodextrin glucosidase [Klebsiella pneumoniae]|uniref:Maltodextrin glucosidase n=1 Tax=Klebsiella pneumoniae TaxID=573 RepID=A0A377W8T5_KLEPN|nr:maltodextrin glucosidase [Klebsiella pneumoniae]